MITIDDRTAEISPGETIMQVADRLGIDIPRMCHRNGLPTFTSCMVCQVHNHTSNAMTPACSVPAEDGMVIETVGEVVETARRTAIELLLSEHLGDCEGPCTVFCPAGMNIPLMIRQIAAGAFADALKTVKADIALPAVLGRACSAPCENACRRTFHDDAVSICKLKRFVADLDLDSETPWVPEKQPSTGKRIAVIGGGPMGLAAAWHLCIDGHDVTVFDASEILGGGLRETVGDGRLEHEVIDREIELILSSGVNTRLSTRLGKDLLLSDLLATHDAVLMGFQPDSIEMAEALGLPTGPKGVIADRKAYTTASPGLFARAGLATGSTMSVRAVGAGKTMAQAVTAYLASKPTVVTEFNSLFGKPTVEDTARFMASASPDKRHSVDDGLPVADAVAEAARCLHCDCRGKGDCALRDLATECGAKQRRFPAEGRTEFEVIEPMGGVVFESGKCIRCGICVRICDANGLDDGFTFLHRGYDVRVGTPFHRPIPEAHRAVIMECVDECPTGALARTE